MYAKIDFLQSEHSAAELCVSKYGAARASERDLLFYNFHIIVNNKSMLDIRSKSVLNFLIKECSEGDYKIIDVDDILSSLPDNFNLDREIVFQIIKYLEYSEYVSVKYSDDEQFCLCPLPFGRQFIEKDKNQSKNKESIKNIGKKIYFYAFFCALLGSFLGTLIYNLITNFKL